MESKCLNKGQMIINPFPEKISDDKSPKEEGLKFYPNKKKEENYKNQKCISKSINTDIEKKNSPGLNIINVNKFESNNSYSSRQRRHIEALRSNIEVLELNLEKSNKETNNSTIIPNNNQFQQIFDIDDECPFTEEENGEGDRLKDEDIIHITNVRTNKDHHIVNPDVNDNNIYQTNNNILYDEGTRSETNI